MNLEQINELTRIAYNKTADKYHEHFKNEIAQKEYDRLLLDKFSALLPPASRICDAGCGPSGHIGKYLADKGHNVVGIDISERCVGIATSYNPQMEFRVMDMMKTEFEAESFDAILSFYSIIYTPKHYVDKIFAEFNRLVKPGGKVLVVVKKGTNEGIVDNAWYEGNPVQFTHFMEHEIKDYFSNNDFDVDLFDVREPYDFEFNVDRIYAIGTKKSIASE
ncbi:class I SAM-dependent methyltransferase [Chryseolinea lacunae]|uniref:Class I SAM-dependent methyltransferase n=1 Tax=Chryseolinea lacunae TaxID=2801331 RepID=A0ABS1KX02_9BACT|nr:class I SAM-dependent methyltransferase [Chryseolinea lacunae]MBL0743985.1 class I SAM-dependent methyltransferase [Chryseolinea lacunae]